MQMLLLHISHTGESFRPYTRNVIDTASLFTISKIFPLYIYILDICYVYNLGRNLSKRFIFAKKLSLIVDRYNYIQLYLEQLCFSTFRVISHGKKVAAVTKLQS